MPESASFVASAGPATPVGGRSAAVPAVAYIYCDMATIAAQDWLSEHERVIERGEGTSAMFGSLLGLGYKIMLRDAVVMARALVAAGRPTAPLTGFYWGLENRDEPAAGSADSRFSRIFEHGTNAGNDNFNELLHFTSQRGGARL